MSSETARTTSDSAQVHDRWKSSTAAARPATCSLSTIEAICTRIARAERTVARSGARSRAASNASCIAGSIRWSCAVPAAVHPHARQSMRRLAAGGMSRGRWPGPHLRAGRRRSSAAPRPAAVAPRAAAPRSAGQCPLKRRRRQRGDRSREELTRRGAQPDLRGQVAAAPRISCRRASVRRAGLHAAFDGDDTVPGLACRDW